ncbi:MULTISPECIES: sulfatase family protein [unclassified Carboxylicivirga]|uniref:sulfatase family protein n=1 Tax=Carboxylicivirga TaxID=1628153 RepID=UPI003D335560
MRRRVLFLLTIIIIGGNHQASADGFTHDNRPNVVLIVVDDLGYADMSFLSQAPQDVKAIGTPAIDLLAEKGAYFTNAYSTAPICSPSRAGLITGRYQQRWGNYWYNEGGLPSNELTIPQALKKLGYNTKKVGKTHMNGGAAEYPTDHGFDEFLGFMHHTWDYIRLSEKDVEAYKAKGVEEFGCQVIGPLVKNDKREEVSYENGFTTEIFTDEAIEFVKRDRGGQPFYIQLSYNAVHQPTYVVPEKYANLVGIPYTPFDRNADKWEFPYWEPTDMKHQEFHNQWGHMGKIYPYGRKAYLAQLKALDDNIRRLYNTLDEEGKLENTIIIFISDNGGTINTYSDNTPLRGYKYMFGEGGIRIPMIISWPQKIPAAKFHNLVSSMDLFPTLLALVGGSIPENLDGKSLLPVFNNDSIQHHLSLCWAKGSNKIWAVRKGDWKLTSNCDWEHRGFKYEDGLCVEGPDDYYPGGTNLFNLKEDIGEVTNLAEKYPEKVKELTGIYKNWKRAMSRPQKANDNQ